MSLKGGAELRARLRALKTVFKPIGREWGDDVVVGNRRAVASHRKTGRLDRSFRVRNASQRKATVVGHFSAYFLDKGTVAHDIVPKKAGSLVFQGRKGIVFTKRVKHPRTAARPFRQRVAEEALRKRPLLGSVIRAWNSARGLR